MEGNSCLVKMVNISKSFGAVQALRSVSIEVRHKEVIGLLGDNGAGKSTLIKILAGVFPPDQGEIYFDGERVNFASPQQARTLGIETVHQGLSLVNTLGISRNFFLGREPTKRMGPISRLDKKKMGEVARRLIGQVGITVRTPDDLVSLLSGGERQAVSIARAMYFGARLLILDEPMTALSVRETRRVIEHIKEAREAGASIIFITHNVYHVYPVADKIVLLTRGVKSVEFPKEARSIEEIEELIAKREGLAANTIGQVE